MIFPNIKRLGLEVVLLEKYFEAIPTGPLYAVRASDLERILEAGVRVTGDKDSLSWSADGFTRSHTALLIAIEPIKRDSAERLLKELIAVDSYQSWNGWLRELQERARKVLDER